MTRYRAIFDGQGLKAEIENGEVLFWRPETTPDNRSDLPTPQIMRDIEPYKNMIDGQMISSRSEHRELLARHNCFEVGNEPFKPPAPPIQKNTRREVLAKRMGDMSDKQANKLLKQLKKGA